MRIIFIVLVILLLVGLGIYKSKDKPTSTSSQDQVVRFKDFFVELNRRALVDDIEFVAKTMPSGMIASIQKLRGITKEQILQRKMNDLKTVDMQSVKYSNSGTNFSIEALSTSGDGYSWNYVNMDGNWVEHNDLIPTVEQIETVQGLSNQYQLNLYGKGNADFRVSINGQELKQFALSNPDGASINSLLYVKPGKNNVVINIIPKNTEVVTYAYDIYEFPKDELGQPVIFSDDAYKLFSSTPEGKSTGFVKINNSETISFEIEVK